MNGGADRFREGCPQQGYGIGQCAQVRHGRVALVDGVDPGPTYGLRLYGAQPGQVLSAS
jgi:hypothetical protein